MPGEDGKVPSPVTEKERSSDWYKGLLADQCPRVRHACRPYRHTRDWSVRIVLEAVPYYYRLSRDTSC